MYEPRWYRQNMGERFKSFTYRFMETDIWIAFDISSKVKIAEINNFADRKCRDLRKLFENYFLITPEFEHTLKPLNVPSDAPKILKELSECSFKTGVGPMAGIAGAFSEEIGKACKKEFEFNEIMVENGGDDYIDVLSDIHVKLFAGNHPLSNKIKLIIEAGDSPLGLCASSGKFGHSKSFGSADLVSVACKNTILADQFATAFANKIRKSDDIEVVLKEASTIPEIIHIAVFMDDKFGIGGKLKVGE
ncbi:MAG: UPF0280 family protein [Candidatus Marinimicrobia bacterium]|nr:UPF0280 family protein [Candidatus Neomarinimicrobiota bacterium]